MAVWKQCSSSDAEHEGPALFLDRDGVVIVDRGYLSDRDQVELLPGVAETMRAAADAGYLLIGVSNQSGLGRGLFTVGDLDRVMVRLDQLLAREGTGFDGFYYCPHVPQNGCRCRKPATGLLDEAAESCRWDPTLSWVVGDKISDVALGQKGGLGSVLVRTGYGVDHEDEVRRLWKGNSRVIVADDLAAAFNAILQIDRKDPDR